MIKAFRSAFAMYGYMRDLPASMQDSRQSTLWWSQRVFWRRLPLSRAYWSKRHLRLVVEEAFKEE